jgi:hypothetical protein
MLTCMLAAASVSHLEASERKASYPCHYFKGAGPVLDGKMDGDPFWESVAPSACFVVLGKNTAAEKKTFFKMAYNDHALYIAVRCQEPQVNKIKSLLGDGENVWSEDSVEIFLFPQDGSGNYFQFVVSAGGARYNGEGFEKLPLSDWRASVCKGRDFYSVEVKIPFEALMAAPAADGEAWTGNIIRNILTSGPRHWTWSTLNPKKGFHDPDNFNALVFEKGISANKVQSIVAEAFKKRIAEYLKSVLPVMRKNSNEDDLAAALFIRDHKCIKDRLPILNRLSLKEKRRLLEESRMLPPRMTLNMDRAGERNANRLLKKFF